MLDLSRLALNGPAGIAWAVLSLFGAPANAAEDLPSERLQSILEAAVADGVSGIVVRVETSDGLVWTGSAGLTRLGGTTAMTVDAPFRVFSVSKMATAATAMMLVDDGLLSLEDPITRWLDAEMLAGLPGADEIVLDHLITQTSGIRDYFDEQFVGKMQSAPDRQWDPKELVAIAAEGDAFAAPGGDISYYSNTNYVLLGLIAEAVTGRSLSDVVRTRLLEPLRMRTRSPTTRPGPSSTWAATFRPAAR